ncbi:MAG: DUF4163 domain-containing protein [Pseudomonadota bacterium]
MKQWLGLGVLALLFGCSSADEIGAEVGVAEATTEAAATDQAEPRKIEVKSDVMTFEYAWPGEVVGLTALNAVFETRAAEAQDTFRTMATEAKADAEEFDYPYRAYASSWGWQVVGETPRFLSLVGESYSYTGGAHGNTTYAATLWDKEAEEEIGALDLFTSADALDAAIRPEYCDLLKAQRAERLGDVEVLGDCPPLGDFVLSPLSSNGEHLDGLQLLAAPYVAGAYAEGSYTVALDIDADVLAIVAPEYRDAFAGSD